MLIINDFEGTPIPSSKKYASILFDLGKVLIPFDFSRAYNRMAFRCELSPEDTRTRLAATRLFVDFESGAITSAAFADIVSRELGFGGSFDEFCEIWTSIFLPDPLLPDSLIARLRQDYRTIIVSNTNEIHFEMLRKTYPILGHFDDYVLSYRVRAMKPGRAFYEAAIESAGCRPDRCLFIDDLAENVEGARAAGMDAIQFVGREALESELKSRGVL